MLKKAAPVRSPVDKEKQMDPFSVLQRQDPCWCGSGKTYRLCHRKMQTPGSQPGDVLPEDTDDSIWISPSISMPRALSRMMAPRGTSITVPSNVPQPKAVQFSELDRLAAYATHEGKPLDPKELGRLRVEALTKLSKNSDNGMAVSDSQLEAVFMLAVATLHTVNALTERTPELTLLWNDQLEADVFLSRTLLLADHVFVPDLLLEAASREPTNRTLREAALSLLKHKNLLESGVVIPVPNGVVRAAQGKSVMDQTAGDLAQPEIVDFIRDQLILEGPTAREVLLVTAKDDPEVFTKMWFYARMEPSGISGSGQFATRMLSPYDPVYDYSPWIHQVKNDAISYYAQRTNERLIAADLFGAQYVSASPFEARLLRHRSNASSLPSPQAAIWADIPLLGDLSSAGLASLLRNEESIQNLRSQVRVAMMSVKEYGQDITAISQLTNELENASRTLEKRIHSSRLFSGYFSVGSALGALAVGSTGGLTGIAGGTLGALSSLMPYIGSRVEARREASYIYVAARRIRKRESRRKTRK